MEQNLELKTKTVDYDETADKIVHKYTAGQFEGPLDLLWTLIRDNKINIYDIPIAEITEQFLELIMLLRLNLAICPNFTIWRLVLFI